MLARISLAYKSKHRRHERTVVTLQRKLAIPGNGVICGKLEDGQSVNHNTVISIVVDGVAAQAVEQRAKIHQDPGPSIAGDVDPAVDVSVGVVGHLDSALAVAVDLGCSR